MRELEQDNENNETQSQNSENKVIFGKDPYITLCYALKPTVFTASQTITGQTDQTDQTKEIKPPKKYDISGTGNIFYCKGLEVMSLLSENDRTATDVYERNGVTFEIKDIESFVEIPILGAKEYKLLTAGLFVFTTLNNHKVVKDGRREPYCETCFSLSQFMKECGRNTANKETVKSFREEVSKSLYTLRNAKMTYNQKCATGINNYVNVYFIGTHGIKDDVVYMTFDPSFAKILIKLPCTKYCSRLFRLGAKKTNALNIGKAMLNHFTNPNNHTKHTANKLQVETLLKYTNLPDFQTVKERRKSWEEKIKEPFYNALDDLTKNLIIQDWDIVDSNGVKLTDEQKDTSSFLFWSSYYIEFKFYKDLEPSLLPRPKKTAKKPRKKTAKKPRKKTTKNQQKNRQGDDLGAK